MPAGCRLSAALRQLSRRPPRGCVSAALPKRSTPQQRVALPSQEPLLVPKIPLASARDAMPDTGTTAVSQDSGGDLPCGRIPRATAEIKLSGWGGARPGAGRKPKAEADPGPVIRPGYQWYVVYTHPQAERVATRDLTDKGYRVYLPMQAIRRRDRVVRTMFHTVHVPMFSRYLFVELDIETDPWAPVRYADGVRELFMSRAMRPLPVPTGFVEGLMATEGYRLHLRDPALSKLPIGTAVRVDSGSFISFPGVVASCDGVTTEVTMQIFGRPTLVTVPRERVDVV